jgi:uncharacterized protein (UPF0248 family)
METYEILSRLKWAGNLAEAEIVIIHRGAENNRKTIPGASITEVKKSHFYYKNDEETYIPMHRIAEIRLKGETIWRKKEK